MASSNAPIQQNDKSLSSPLAELTSAYPISPLNLLNAQQAEKNEGKPRMKDLSSQEALYDFYKSAILNAVMTPKPENSKLRTWDKPRFSDKPMHVNVVGIRGWLNKKPSPNVKNRYNDTIVVLWIDHNGNKFCREFLASVDPGENTKKVRDKRGDFIMAPGQYEYVDHTHNARKPTAHKAFSSRHYSLPAGAVDDRGTIYYLDKTLRTESYTNNQGKTVKRSIEERDGKITGDELKTKAVAHTLNIHAGGHRGDFDKTTGTWSGAVGNQSAGCQVIANSDVAGAKGKEWKDFKKLLDARDPAQKVIVYTLVEGSALAPALYEPKESTRLSLKRP